MDPRLKRLVTIINKKSKSNIVFTIDDERKRPFKDRLGFGIPTLDSILYGGIPDKPCFIEFFGKESSGKTYLACMLAKRIQESGDNVFYVDAEGSLDLGHIQGLGVNPEMFAFTQESGAERVFDIICKVVEMPEPPKLIVVDSVAALTPEKEEPDKMGVAELARVLSRGLRVVNQINKSSIILLINQVRETISLYAAETTPGGRALRHWSSIRMDIRQGTRIKQSDAPTHKKHIGKEKDDVIGHHINIKVAKNKTAIPFGSTRLFYYTDTGVDILEDTVRHAIQTGEIDQTGAYYRYGEHKYHGRDAIINALAQGEISIGT